MTSVLRTDAAAPMPSGEVFGPLCAPPEPDLPVPIISYGLPFDKAVARHVAEDARVYVLASRSLCANTDALDRLKAVLGAARFAGARVGMTSHTILSECLEVAAAIREAKADTVVTLGAGSLADAAKLACSAQANEFGGAADLAKHAARIQPDGSLLRADLEPFRIKLIMIPTTLSAGEHTPAAGVTDGATGRKYQILTGGASVTILDPWLALDTPANIWLQSGVRGLDHAVEHACSTHGRPADGSPARQAVVDLCTQGLALLVPGLMAVAAETTGSANAPKSLAAESVSSSSSTAAESSSLTTAAVPSSADRVLARLNAQLGVAMAITPLLWGVWAGASHGIGHMLGPAGGIAHGDTSCILLPAVCRYNAVDPAAAARQRAVARALWQVPQAALLFDQKRFVRGDGEAAKDGAAAPPTAAAAKDESASGSGSGSSSGTPLADLLDAVIRALGMPRSLAERDFGGDDARLRRLADVSLHDFFLTSNPRPISNADQVMEILKAVEY